MGRIVVFLLISTFSSGKEAKGNTFKLVQSYFGNLKCKLIGLTVGVKTMAAVIHFPHVIFTHS